MNRTTRFLSLAAALAAVACSSAPPPEAPTPEAAAPEAEARRPSRPVAPSNTIPAIDAEDLRRHLTILAADSMMGRESGTLGNYMATEYLAREAARLGLEPAGDDGTYFQTLPLVERRLDLDATFAVAGEPFEIGTDYLPLPSFGGFLPFGMAGSLDGVQTVYAGPADAAERPSTPEQFAGKLVVFGPPSGPMQPDPEGWSYYASAAGLALTVLDFIDPQFRGYLLQPSASLGGDLPQGPLGLVISNAAAVRLLGMPLDQVTVGAAGNTIEGTFRYTEEPVPYAARNVVAIVRGSDPELRDEYVAISAHNDHDGPGAAVEHDSIWAFNHVVRPEGAESPMRPATPEEQVRIDAILDSLRAVRAARPDSIYNGADDDGSGTVAMLEIAEAFARSREKPQRSILFVWHTAEEKGLLGARHFTDNPSVPRESIVADLNIDMVGRGSEGDIENGGPAYLQLIGSRRLSTELGDLVETINTASGLNFAFDYQYDAEGHPQQYYCRSDHYMYARYGIPIVFFSTGSHQDYHQVTDETAYINYPKMARASQLIFEVARAVANLDHRLVIDGPVPDPNAPCVQ